MLEKSLDRAAYVDDEKWAVEKHKVFASNWFCIGRHDEVGSTSGSYKLVDLQGEQVLVVRGADLLLRAFVNMCSHRGTELVDSTDASASDGCFGALIRCPYHHWTFNTDGSLRGAPHLAEIDYDAVEQEADAFRSYFVTSNENNATQGYPWPSHRGNSHDSSREGCKETMPIRRSRQG